MNFKTFLIALIVLVGVFSVNASATPSAALYIQQRAQNALYEQMLKSRSEPMLRSNIGQCHPHYSEVLKNLLDTYEKELQKCEQNENEALESLATEGQQSRDETTATLNEVCGSLDVCKAESENLKFFDCVNQSGDKNTRNVWKSSKDSSDTAARIREQIHAIKYQTGRCRSEADRKYIVDTAKATDDMMACYANGGVIPTPPDAPATDAPATDAPATDAPATDAPATDAPATDAPATDAPATDAPATDAPATDAPATDAPATDAPATDAPSTDGPATDAPATDAPATDAPATDAPATDAPATDAPATDAPATEAPATDAPATDAPATDAPATDAPATDAPATDAPATDAPATDAPSTDAPATDAPATDAPATDAPATEAPATDAPATDAPSSDSDEMDQVEELEENNVRSRLENFMRNWGKRV
ncbi:threonine-rich protein-like isoform X2 [Eupeodes corollae]|uniref:threonine-rich protein-like isoform X2 n=1 Tax=Eupeodes corollae TaxID=290404 RepID=UPI002491D1A8|nr:threonine-rich protein-like isoform X2 [Eupeodes corollae]